MFKRWQKCVDIIVNIISDKLELSQEYEQKQVNDKLNDHPLGINDKFVFKKHGFNTLYKNNM